MAGILEPLTIRNRTLKNRVVLPPIVVFWAEENGEVSDRQVAHYRRRARGGCGLIVVEATCVAPKGRLSAHQLGIWDDSQISGLSRIAEACRAEGAATLIQIHHAGLSAPSDVTDGPVSASDYQDEKRSAREMTTDEIAFVRDSFVDSARRAWKAGFDGVELHGAHGYLLSQFASPIVNQRGDRYGGDLDGRLRLAREIIEGIRASVSDDSFLITCRMGCNEPELDNGIAIARALEQYGVDALHVSSGFGGSPEPEAPDDFQASWIAWCGSEIRKHVSVPVIAVYGIRTHEQASWLLDGRVDMVALARGLLVDPDWALKAETGEEIVTCLECKPRCKWFKDGRDCPRYDVSWE
jgi:NADPH2 dehydrogenase